MFFANPANQRLDFLLHCHYNIVYAIGVVVFVVAHVIANVKNGRWLAEEGLDGSC